MKKAHPRCFQSCSKHCIMPIKTSIDVQARFLVGTEVLTETKSAVCVCEREILPLFLDRLGAGSKKRNRSSGNPESSVCTRSGPDLSYGPKTRTGPKFGTGPKTDPPKIPKFQYIISVLKMKVAHFAAFVVPNMGKKSFNCR